MIVHFDQFTKWENKNQRGNYGTLAKGQGFGRIAAIHMSVEIVITGRATAEQEA